jgi:hypothetical protein
MERCSRAVGATFASGLATLAVALMALAARPAQADEFEIKSPLVEQGELEFETHSNVQWGFPEGDEDEGGGGENEDEARQFHELSIGYGVTDWWEPELELTLQQLKHDHLKVDTIGLENTFQLLPTNT